MGNMNSDKQPPPPYHRGNSSEARRSLGDIQETLSQVYVTGICAMAGYTVRPTNPDVNKVDLTVDGIVSGIQSSVRLQLKATYQEDRARGDTYAYRIKDSDLRQMLRGARGHPSPLVLVVLHLPRNHNEWLTNDADQLTLQRCAYWLLCEDINNDTQTVHIPRTNLFDVRSIRKLMDTSAERIRGTQARWQANH